jgi:hypothetical protein
MVELILRPANLTCVILDADDLLVKYRTDPGYDYLNYEPITPADVIYPEDLAITLLMNSQVGRKAFQSIQKHNKSIDLTQLPEKPLENTSLDDRKLVAELITKLAQFPGIAASVATKLLHKKRPALIPILDNQAIFGAYMNPEWPKKPAHNDSVRDGKRIAEALEWIYLDLTRSENMNVWTILSALEPKRHRIEVFDCVWWEYFDEERRKLHEK